MTSCSSAATVQVWPERLSGRQLRALADAYALYANDERLANELCRWLDRQLSNHHLQYALPVGRGLVLAVEPGSEPVPEIEDWQKPNIDRRRIIHWTSDSERGDSLRTCAGRPYSFFQDPYFRESFGLPQDDALRIGILDASTPRPAWICVLTTDAHVTGAFDEKIREYERELSAKAAEELKRMPADQVFCHWLFWLGYKLCVPVYRSIDVELMHLQRGEAQRGALIQNAVMDEEQRDRALSRLRDETDEAWKELYFSRPVE